jgi:energy-coupling factor transporter transmembrane protein EcfT
LVWAVVLAILAPGVRVFVVVGLVVAFSALFCKGGLRPLRRWAFWFLVASALALSPFFIGDKDVSLFGLGLSYQGFWVGLWMALRGVSIMLAMNAFSNAVSITEVARLFEWAGLKGLGFAIGVAFNMLPTIRETIDTLYQAIKLRGGFRRKRLTTVRTLAIAVVVNSLRHGEEIVNAAEARAFDPKRHRAELPSPTWADLALGIGLLLGVWILTN